MFGTFCKELRCISSMEGCCFGELETSCAIALSRAQTCLRRVHIGDQRCLKQFVITLVMTYTLSLPLWALQIPFNVFIAMAGLLCPPCPRKSSSPQRPLTCLTHCHSCPSLLLGRRAYCAPWGGKRRPTEPARAQVARASGLGPACAQAGLAPTGRPKPGPALFGPGWPRARPRQSQAPRPPIVWQK